MIAIDTSSISAYLDGQSGADVEVVDQCLADQQAVLPPVVLTELLSTPRLRPAVARLFRGLPMLPLLDGYWDRAGALRARILGHRLKARLADALIAQSCLDHRVALITRDEDFRHFARFAALKLLP